MKNPLRNGVFFFLFFAFVPGYANETSLDEVVRGYSDSMREIGHIAFSYRLEKFINGQFSGETVGKIFSDRTNVRHYFEDIIVGRDQKTQHEDVIAPGWDTFFRIARNEQGKPVVISCYEVENIPPVSQTLGPVNFLFGKLFFRDFEPFGNVLQKVGSDHVIVAEINDHVQIRFVYLDYKYRILLDSDTFALVLFEKNSLSKRTKAFETESYLFEVLASQEENGMVFPTKFVVVHSISGNTSTDGNSDNRSQNEKTEYKYSLSNFSFDHLSENDFHLSIELPNGTEAHLRDVPQIQHVWLDGKIVPKTDELMLAIAQGGHKFMPGPDEPRFWMMGIGIALILFACGKKTYDYFKNKK